MQKGLEQRSDPVGSQMFGSVQRQEARSESHPASSHLYALTHPT